MGTRNDSEFVRVSEAADILRVTPQTIRKYRKQGKLRGYETGGNQMIYKRTDILKLLGADQDEPEDNTPQEQKLAFYIRANDGDNTKLKTQLDALTQKYGKPIKVYKDKASGLNEKRKGLNRLLDDARNGEINVIRYTQKDRLTRFGYTYLTRLLEEYGCDAQAASDKDDKTLQEELMQDFMSLIASFSGKFYRMRGYEQKRQLLKDAEERFEEREKTNTTKNEDNNNNANANGTDAENDGSD